MLLHQCGRGVCQRVEDAMRLLSGRGGSWVASPSPVNATTSSRPRIISRRCWRWRHPRSCASWPGMGCMENSDPRTRDSQGGREAARRGGCGPGTGRGPQAPDQAGGSDRVGDGKGQVKQSRKGCRTYTYWMACWREGDKTRRPPEAPGRWI